MRHILSIDVGWVNPAYLLGTWDAEARTIHLVEYIPFSSEDKERLTSGRRGITNACTRATFINKDIVHPFLSRVGVTDLAVVCESQPRRNVPASLIEAHTIGFFMALGHETLSMTAVHKFKYVPEWGERYKELMAGTTRGNKAHKRLSVEIGKGLVANQKVADELTVTISDSVHKSLADAKCNGKEDDVYDAMLQLVAFCTHKHTLGKKKRRKGYQ